MSPLLFCWGTLKNAETFAEIELKLAENLPEVELVDLDISGGRGNRFIRVFIDHPQGVDHELCARANELLREYSQDHTVEVSSPGVEKRLRKPEHFRDVAGEKINVKTYGPVEGQRNFTGFLVSVSNDELVLKLDDREVTIPLDDVARARTVFDFGKAE